MASSRIFLRPRAAAPVRKITWLRAALPSGGSTQNVTMTTATLKFVGFPMPMNQKQMFSTVLAPLKFNGFPTAINAKSQFALPTGIVTWAGRPLNFSNGALITLPTGLLKLIGFPVGINAKSQITLPSGKVTFSGSANIVGTVLFQIPQATIQFIGRAANFGGAVVARLLALLGVGL